MISRVIYSFFVEVIDKGQGFFFQGKLRTPTGAMKVQL